MYMESRTFYILSIGSNWIVSLIRRLCAVVLWIIVSIIPTWGLMFLLIHICSLQDGHSSSKDGNLHRRLLRLNTKEKYNFPEIDWCIVASYHLMNFGIISIWFVCNKLVAYCTLIESVYRKSWKSPKPFVVTNFIDAARSFSYMFCYSPLIL